MFKPAATAGQKPAPQLTRPPISLPTQFVTEPQLITIVCLSQFIQFAIHLEIFSLLYRFLKIKTIFAAILD